MTLSAAAILAGQITAILACVAAITLTARKSWRGYRKAKVFGAKVARAIEQLENNGGSSMRDKLDRVADNVDSMTTVVDGISETQDVQGEKLDALTVRFESHLTLQAEASVASSRAVEAAVSAQPPPR